MNTELTNALQNILADADGDYQAALEALEDGDYLGSLELTQEQVEEIYNYIKDNI